MNTNNTPIPSSPTPAEASDPVAGRCAVALGSPFGAEAVEILKHTYRTGRYVTDPCADTHALTINGYLNDHGAQRLAGGLHYYTITTLGRHHLRTLSANSD